ncbi:hypothetical protein [Haladaptatus halobius]|uniref:hypothetical protein n=1 Tax=Haladaptatus halobius TaxID=2884875 RepID=UPI001D0BC402|nr:hypothetical protein [Haladaptatus halobius]
MVPATDGDPSGEIDVVESDAERIESSEHEFAMRATATIDGPAGRLAVRRQYDALPYHNDVVYPDGPDSNDERVERPNEIHVHTRFYAVSDDSDDDEAEYFADAHETWTSEEPTVLSDADELARLCTDHHLADPAALYRDAMERR